MRVYEYAKELKLESKDLVKILNDCGYNDKVAISVLNDNEILDIKKKLKLDKVEEKKVEKAPVKQHSHSNDQVISEKIVFSKNKPHNGNKEHREHNKDNKERRDHHRDRNQNFGERKPFNRDNRENRENGNFRDNRENRENRENGNFRDNRENRDNKDGGFKKKFDGERKPFNRDNRENRENSNFRDNREGRDNKDGGFKKRFDGDRKPFNRENDNKRFSKPFAKEEKENNLEIPTLETEAKKSTGKVKSKFDKKKYENDKKNKEEERKLKELKNNFQKEDRKKKVKKKEKVVKSEVIRDEEGGLGIIVLPQEISIKELAEKLGINTSDIIKKFFMAGKILTANAILTLEEAEEIAMEHNVIVEAEEVKDVSFGEKFDLEIEDKETELNHRAPVITIMGHVDHGKTSLLDALRSTNVIATEAGGITQRIGAYQIDCHGEKITFIDTPGHEAFTEMRIRGANITDIAVLIVAADDGVKPQTVEAISHAKEANVPIIVAINKIDKPGANPMKVKQELTEYGLISPEWGGSTEMVEISAKQKINLDGLLETILITTEIMELKSNYNKRAKAVVIESKLDPQIGPVASLLIQEGTLEIGDSFVAGGAYGRVRNMTDDKGQKLRKSVVSQPVSITGFNGIPEAGSVLYVVENDKKAKKIVEEYLKDKKDEVNKKKHISLESLSKELEDQNLKELKCIIRADSKGTAEALKESLLKLSNDKVNINVIQSSAGAVTEGDVMLAAASNAIIIAFSVKASFTATNEAERNAVEIRNYNVIYHVTEDIEKAMTGMLDPEYNEIFNGRLKVTNIFKISNVGNIAGGIVTEGKITNKSKLRVIRDGENIYEGDLATLKRYKDQVKEVTVTQDCGIAIKDFTDIKVDDIIEAFTLEKVKR